MKTETKLNQHNFHTLWAADEDDDKQFILD